MGQDPSQLREELEETRARVGEEVDALSYKTDVGARVGDYVGDKKDAVTSKLAGVKDVATKPIPDRAQIRKARRTAERSLVCPSESSPHGTYSRANRRQ